MNTRNLKAEIYRNGQSLGTFLAETNDQLIIGSAKAADLVVPGEKTSPIHAMLRLTEREEIFIYDLGSDAGTFVNGSKIVEHRLANGDFFEISGHKIKVELLANEEISLSDPRQSLFRQVNLNSFNHLDGVAFRNEIACDDFTVEAGKSAQVFTPSGKMQIARRETVECDFVSGSTVEIYDSNNQLLQVVESGEKFHFKPGEKCRIRLSDWELLLYWRAESVRHSRAMPEGDQYLFRRSLSLSLATLLLIGLGSLLMPKEESETTEASYPKTSYLRVTDSSAGAPQGEASAGQTAQPNAAQAITNSLAQILNKKDAISAESISKAVAETGRAARQLSGISTSNVKQTAISGGLAGAVNTNAISAGLKAGGNGAGGTLAGFAKGAGNGVGLGNGLGGKGFSLNLGDDEAEAQGGLDKALIAAVVQANLGQIKNCYEKRLVVDPNLAGKIVAQWVIDKDGLVPSTSLKSTTMNSAPVENCILGKIKTWKFPQPRGGGKVIVSYPFLFKPMN